MKIKLHQGSTLFDATEAMISSLDNSDFSIMHIIVVPDRFSLQCEKLVLKLLNRKALFNVKVVNLTQFSVDLLGKLGVKGINDRALSSAESLLLTAKAIENTAKDFKTFKKSGMDFCFEISKIISQLKSSDLKPCDLIVNAKGLTANKYHDLSLIYNEYERLLGDKLDANARLALLNEKLKDSKILENTKIYFAHFDAFTKNQYNLINAFVESAKEVNISFSVPESIGNEYIYEKDILSKISAIASEKNILVDVCQNSVSHTPQKEAIIKGLFSYQKVKCENKGFFSLFSCISEFEEIEACARLIRFLVYKGFKFRDIQIVVGNLRKSCNQIENIFSQYDIPYYIDTSVTADKTILSNLVKSYFEVVVMGYAQDKMIDLLANPLANSDQCLIERCQRFSVEGKQRYKKYIEKDFINADIFNKIEKAQKAVEFEAVILEILDRAMPQYEKMLEILEKREDLKTRNINSQIYDIIKESVSLISNEVQEEISAGEYFKLLSLLLSFKQVSTVPSYVDGIFVGDGKDSFFGKGKIFIVLDGENLPAISDDNGLLSDDDIQTNVNKKIEPTIRMINRRNRFKLFSLLTQAQEKLFVFTKSLDEEGKKIEEPSYIKNLCDIFSQAKLKAGNVFFSRASSNPEVVLLSYPNFKKEEPVFADKYSREKNLSILKDLSCDQSLRVTQIEQYFSCPFKHFATYGLKLKEFEIDKFDGRDIGNICHKGAEILLKEMIKNNNFNYDINLLKKFIDNNFDKIIEDERLQEKLENLIEKNALIKFIKKQMLSLFKDIIREINLSLFKPDKIEYKFNYKIDEKTSLIGKVDRIDICEDYFRIIDYKTGATGNILKELKFGQKLQLFLYQKFAKEKFKKRPGGVFYFDAKFDYSKNDKEDVLLKGLAPNEDRLFILLDKEIENAGKSEILSLYKSKKDSTYKGSIISKYDISELENYAEKITNKAIEEIREGNISPKPHENSCQACKYSALCGFEKKKGIRRLKF